jgi:hypothetical protein
MNVFAPESTSFAFPDPERWTGMLAFLAYATLQRDANTVQQQRAPAHAFE